MAETATIKSKGSKNIRQLSLPDIGELFHCHGRKKVQGKTGVGMAMAKTCAFLCRYDQPE